MDTFKFLLFGLAGFSLIFWVAIIALWHTYMFPRFFKEDRDSNTLPNIENKPLDPILGNLIVNKNFQSREKYAMRNMVIADFSTDNNLFKLNKLYTLVMISVAVTTFTFITYGLSSSLTNIY